MMQPANTPPLSAFRNVGTLVFVSGQVPVVGPDRRVPDGFDAQVTAALENLKAVVNAAGADLGTILKVNVFLADRRHIPAFNQAYRAFFDGHELPARTMLIAELPDPRYLVEIECTAFMARI